MNRLITPSRALAYTPFYLDLLADSPSARDLFVSSSVDDSLRRIAERRYDPYTPIELLRRQAQAFGSSPEAFRSIEKLADPAAVCLFTGQQAGLLGGPLLTLIKALGVVKRARLYEARYKRPVIPIFWIAADDHDFLEANHTWLVNRDSEPVKIAYDAHPPVPLSVGATALSDSEALARMHAALRDCLGDSEFTGALYDTITQSYTSEDTLVSAFGKMMTQLTAGTGLVLFSPYDARVKELAVPLFKDILINRDRLHDTLNKSNHALESRGYHLQVEKHEQSCFLFIDDHGRKPILKRGDQYVVGDRAYSQGELFALMEREPLRFSPDALTRPLLQSYLFPVISQLGGPAELAYLAQMNRFFEVLNVPAPYHTSRPTATIVEKRYEKLMDDLSIEFEELTGDIEQVVNRVLAKTFPHDIEANAQTLRDDFAKRYESFTATTLTFDPGLDDFARQTYGKIDFSLKALEAKLFASHKKKSKETRDRIYRLGHALHPNHALQERSLNICYFVARYGTGLISYLLEHLDAEQTAHQLISLSDYEP